MSSASVGSWSVVDNLALQRRILADRQARAQELVKKAESLCGKCSEAKARFGSGFPTIATQPPEWQLATGTVVETDQLIEQIEAFNHRLETDLAQALTINQMRQLLSSLVSSETGQQDSPSVAELPAPTRAEREVEIEALFNGVSTCMDMAELRNIARDAVAEEGQNRFATLKIELKYRIQMHNKTARLREDTNRTALHLRDRLAGLEGQEVKALLEELSLIEKGELDLRPSLVSTVEETVTQAQRRADKEYAGQVLREELTKLGYLVGDGFDTLFVEGGRVRLHKADLREYHVMMSINPVSGTLGAYVAREGEPGDMVNAVRCQRDQQMEGAWCKDFDMMLAGSRQKGIHMNIRHQVPPGVQPVSVLPANRRALAAASVRNPQANTRAKRFG